MTALKSLGSLLLPAALFAAVVWIFQAHWQDGYDLGFAQAKSEGDLALTNLKLKHSQLDLERARAAEGDAKRAAQRLGDEQARGDRLASELADAKQQYRRTTDRLTGEIARVNDLYRKARDAAPEPLPACVFTTGFVRVWNEANGIAHAAVPAERATSGAAAPPGRAGAPDDLDAGIGRTDVLTNHIRNAEQCAVVREQLNRLIDWNTENGRN